MNTSMNLAGDAMNELIFDEKERAKIDPKLLLEEFEKDGH